MGADGAFPVGKEEGVEACAAEKKRKKKIYPMSGISIVIDD